MQSDKLASCAPTNSVHLIRYTAGSQNSYGGAISDEFLKRYITNLNTPKILPVTFSLSPRINDGRRGRRSSRDCLKLQCRFVARRRSGCIFSKRFLADLSPTVPFILARTPQKGSLPNV